METNSIKNSTDKEYKIKDIDINYSADDIILDKIIRRLKKNNVNFNESEISENIINNPNFLVLFRSLIKGIEKDKLSDNDSKFFFSLLLNIHSRLFSSIHLGISKGPTNKESIEKFLNEIKIILEGFGNEYKNILNSFDDIISSIRKSYDKILENNNSNGDIIGSIITDSISKIDNLDKSFLSEENRIYILDIATNFRIRLDKIINFGIDKPLEIIIQEKITNLDKIINLYKDTINYKNKDNLNSNILFNTLNELISTFKELIKNSDGILYLDNYFTENVLSTLERIPLEKFNNEELNNEEIKKEIEYILINIAGTRENPCNNKNYHDNNLNTDFIKRSDKILSI